MTKGVLIKYLYNRWRPLLIGRIHCGKRILLALFAKNYGLEGTFSHARGCRRRSGVTPSYAILVWDNSAIILGFWWFLWFLMFLIKGYRGALCVICNKGGFPCRKFGLVKCNAIKRYWRWFRWLKVLIVIYLNNTQGSVYVV